MNAKSPRARLSERVALVTGAAAGIGRAIAEQMAAEGAAIVVLDIDAEGAGAAASDLRASGARVATVVGDVADEAVVASAVETALRDFGRLDVLVNNAAVFEQEIMRSDLDIESTPLATWDRTMDVNLRAAFLASKHAVPVMRSSAGRGSIVNISSTAGFNGDVVFVAYSASKAALQAMTRSIATSHGDRGIRCNCVATGLVLTELAARNLAPEKLAAYRRNRLVDEVGRPEEVAELVTYLASDDARYVQGQTIVIDGGATAHQPWHVLSDVLHPDAPAQLHLLETERAAAAEGRT